MHARQIHLRDALRYQRLRRTVLRALTEVCVVSRSECLRFDVWKASDSRRRSESSGDSGDCLGDGQRLLVVPAPSDYLDTERDTVGVDPQPG